MAPKSKFDRSRRKEFRKTFARELRRTSTDAERKLCFNLRNRRFTLYKFRTMVTNAEQFKHELEAMNEMTLEYSKTRVQFGQPIGSYQVVQHRLSDMFMTQEQGRSMAMLATMSADNPDDAERRHDFALAKVGVAQAGRYVSQSAVQMHGGIGMTMEYKVGHYFKRMTMIDKPSCSKSL